ncbi:MAG: YciI family protein [Terracidiphilus sp.]|jgi:uncharacterized protein YciI
MNIALRILLPVLMLAAPALCAQTSATPDPATSAPARKTWFIRLIPPRPDFDKTLSDAERQVMGQHFLYLKGLNEKGICLFAGPVLDPRGVYGVAVIVAATEDEAGNYMKNDPSVKDGVNRFEIAEVDIAIPLQPR